MRSAHNLDVLGLRQNGLNNSETPVQLAENRCETKAKSCDLAIPAKAEGWACLPVCVCVCVCVGYFHYETRNGLRHTLKDKICDAYK